ncbi:MAG: long-subunit fatty acid transport protein [Bacteriovoracaceae bacterium]|jgi:long-subunit fatty acid transport protein
MRIIAATLVVFLSFQAKANYAEFFGTAPSTSSIGNQANSDEFDPANNYYIPALMAFSDTLTFSTSIASVSTDFEPITSIVTKNSTNSTTGTESGPVSTEYPSYLGSSLHVTLPIAVEGAGTVSFSLFMPLGKTMETNSGDAHLPEYVMYRSRYRRTMIHLNYAHKLSDNFAFSIGSHIGFQAGANTTNNVSLNGTSFGTSAGLKTEVKPSLAAIVSTIYRKDNWSAAFTYQQEMKSNLETQANGVINDPTSALFQITIESMIYYDPHIFRFGGAFEVGNFTFLGTLEYQLWENYKTPVIRVKDRGGVIIASDDFEKVQLRNVPVPKIGTTLKLNDNLTLMAGLSYKPTPLKGNFSGSGNSIDSNSLILTGGGSISMKFFGKDLDLSAGAQYHKLEELNVTKTPNQENGSAGSKIGAPGYKVGGSVIAASGGLRLKF